MATIVMVVVGDIVLLRESRGAGQNEAGLSLQHSDWPGFITAPTFPQRSPTSGHQIHYQKSPQ